MIRTILRKTIKKYFNFLIFLIFYMKGKNRLNSIEIQIFEVLDIVPSSNKNNKIIFHVG